MTGELTGWRPAVHRVSTRLYGPKPAMAGLTWIGEERIAVGSVPTGASIARLTEQGVTHIVNCRSKGQVSLTQELTLERTILGPDRVAHAPMRDLGRRQHPKRWAAAARFAVLALEDPRARVLIHCHQGRRRSVMLAYAVLRMRGHTPDEAARLILDHRIGAILVPAYVDSVERWLASSRS